MADIISALANGSLIHAPEDTLSPLANGSLIHAPEDTLSPLGSRMHMPKEKGVFSSGQSSITLAHGSLINAPEEALSPLATIWEDIEQGCESITLSEINYDPRYLNNTLYQLMDEKKLQRKLFRDQKSWSRQSLRNLNVIQPVDIKRIRKHCARSGKSEFMPLLISALIRPEEVNSIEPLDKVFLNSYYRRLLRAKLEQSMKGKELTPGLIVTHYGNHDADLAIMTTLRLLRVMCRHLGIESTTERKCFSIDKLDMPAFWTSMAEKFLPLFGEERVEPLTELEQGDMLSVAMFINSIFRTWSGTEIELNRGMVEVIPATYITRMLPKMRSMI